MTHIRKKIILLGIGCALTIGATVLLWKNFASTTRIACVNFQAITLGQMAKANDNSFIKLEELDVDRLDKASDYDMILLNGMGLRITDEQRNKLTDAADKGTPVYSFAVTNPQNIILSTDSIDAEFLKQYMTGGRSNYRNMLKYIRKFIDGKKLFADTPGDPVLTSSSLMYYPSEEDDLQFPSVNAFEKFLKEKGKWNPDAPKIILTGQMGVPEELVAELEKRGNTVYPVNVIQRFIAGGHADSIKINAIINMAHGRMGDQVVRYLETRNIPLFSPLNVNRDYHEWADDKMGMSGGFMSQSVVTPEIDGAIRPYSLFAHYEGKDGLPYVAAIPDRLQDFSSTVNNYPSLQSRAKKEKIITIF